MVAQTFQHVVECNGLVDAAGQVRLIQRFGGGEQHRLNDALGLVQRGFVARKLFVAIHVE